MSSPQGGQQAQQAPASSSKFFHSKIPAPKAHLALLAITGLPLVLPIPANVNVIIKASLAVYAGCWRSVKPEPPAEAMTKGDAMRFPLVGSAVLFGLFLAFKFLPKELVNMLLTGYVALLAVLVLTSALLPFVEPRFPKKLQSTTFTLPKFRIPHVIDTVAEPVTLNVPSLVVGALSAAFCAWYVAQKHWLANNVLGLALSLEGIEHLNLGSVHVGCILLVGLFFYDVFWVFCTPVMVRVTSTFGDGERCARSTAKGAGLQLARGGGRGGARRTPPL